MAAPKKAPKVKAQTVSSPYSGIQDYNVSMAGFGNAMARRNGNALDTTSALDPALLPSYDAASRGLGSSLGYLAADPSRRMEDVAAGRNDFYNLADRLAQQDYSKLVAQADNSLGARGLENSTTRGAMLGQLANDQLTRTLQNRVAAINYLDQQANTAAQTQNASLAQLGNFQALPLQAAIQNLQTGYDSEQQAAALNAQLRQQADMVNAQAAANAAAARSKSMGGMIGGGLTAIGSVALAPFTGGASLMALPAAAGMVGMGAAGGGGGGGSNVDLSGLAQNYRRQTPASPAYTFDQYQAMQQRAPMLYGPAPSLGGGSPFVGKTYGL